MKIVVDLDGTVADLTHRLHYILEKPKDHDAFYRGVSEDTPIKPVIAFLKRLRREGHDLIYISGRREETRKDTERWLARHVFSAPLYLRRKRDRRKDIEVKGEVVRALEKEGWIPDLMVEDRPSMIKFWRREGFHVIDVGTWTERQSDGVVSKSTSELMSEFEEVADDL